MNWFILSSNTERSILVIQRRVRSIQLHLFAYRKIPSPLTHIVYRLQRLAWFLQGRYASICFLTAKYSPGLAFMFGDHVDDISVAKISQIFLFRCKLTSILISNKPFWLNYRVGCPQE